MNKTLNKIPTEVVPTVKFSIAPKRIILSTIILLFLVDVFTVFYAGKIPSFDGVLLVIEDRVVFQLQGQNYNIESISGIENEWIAITPSDLIEEPDFFNLYSAFNAFMDKQTDLSRHLGYEKVNFRMSDGQIMPVFIENRKWHELPQMFWLQLAVGSFGMIFGALLWSLRQNDVAARHYFLSAIFLILLINPAAIYSTRPLAIPGDLFHLLSVMNHLGSFLFDAAMLSLVWVFPYPLSKFKFQQYVYVILIFIWLADSLQIIPNQQISQFIATLIMLIILTLITVQYRRYRHQPHILILVKWFIFSIAGAGVFFMAMMFAPPLFGLQPFMSQGSAIIAFFGVYIAMAIAVSRFQLFNLGRWWFEGLLWVTSGLFVIGLDILIIIVIDISNILATWLALVIIGWAYFPIRQLLLQKLLLKQDQDLSRHLPYVVSLIASSSNDQQLLAGLEKCLVKIFSPLHINYLSQVSNNKDFTNNVILRDNGCLLSISLPNLHEMEKVQRIELTFADQGVRLFNNQDQKIANALVELFEHALIASNAKNEGMKLERQRIRQDMHDSLGGYLLAIMHRKNDGESAQLARHAWAELRDILSALDDKPVLLAMELQKWRSALQKLIRNEQLAFNFMIDDSIIIKNIQIKGFERLNLGQILREAIVNAFRHASPTFIRADFSYNNDKLTAVIENDGNAKAPKFWTHGRGITHIRNRTKQLNGTVEWMQMPSKHIVMTVIIPLKEINSREQIGYQQIG